MSNTIHRGQSSAPRHESDSPAHGRRQHDSSHTVRDGDDLQSLASHFGVSSKQIVAANGHLIVDATRPLVIGDRLHIPASAADQASTATVAPAAHQHATRSAGTDATTPSLTTHFATLSAARPAASADHHLQVLTLQRVGGPAPVQSQQLLDIVAGLNGFMRPHHPELGNRNRIVYTSGARAGEQVQFKIAPGTPMVDGTGIPRGTLLEGSVKLNAGQRKLITTLPNGQTIIQPYVYVFSTAITTGGKTLQASGWIPLSALVDSAAKRHYAADLALDVKQGPRGGDTSQHFTLTGGDQGKYGDLKVNPGIERTARQAAGDYLWRQNDANNQQSQGVVNLLYSLPGGGLPGGGGASTDTFRVGVEFIPARGVPRVRVPLYLPKNPTAAETTAWRNNSAPHFMDFVYGRIGNRFGWIARDALAPKH